MNRPVTNRGPVQLPQGVVVDGAGNVYVADYDNDGFADLLVGDSTQNILWHNDGGGGFAAVTETPIQTAAYRPNITWADYDDDGDLDLFATTGGTTGVGTGRLYRNEGNGVFTPITTGQLPELSSNSTGAAWGDYNNDRFPDVFVCRLNNSFEQTLPSFLFHNNGDGTFSRVMSGPGADGLGSSTGVIWGDYDRDGFLDLFIANATVGGGERNDFLYHNDGNSNAWITIKCVGTLSNRSAIGTKVRVKATIGGSRFYRALSR